jgi:hypothetical protein
MKNSAALRSNAFDTSSFAIYGVTSSFMKKRMGLPPDCVGKFNRTLNEIQFPLTCLDHHDFWIEYLDFADAEVLRDLPAAVKFLTSQRKIGLPIGLDGFDSVVMKIRKLLGKLETHARWSEYLDSEAGKAFRTFPEVIDFLRDLWFDMHDYLATTPYERDYMREHGQGD